MVTRSRYFVTCGKEFWSGEVIYDKPYVGFRDVIKHHGIPGEPTNMTMHDSDGGLLDWLRLKFNHGKPVWI